MTTYVRRLQEKPTVESIADFADTYRKLLALSFQKFVKCDSYYNQTYDLWASEGDKSLNRDAYYSPKTRALIDQPVKTQFSDEPKVRREQVGDSEDAAKKASNVEVWSQAALLELDMQALQPLWRTFRKTLCVYGKAFLEGPLWVAHPDIEKPERDQDEDDDQYEARLAAWDYQQSKWFPFRVNVINPAHVLANPFERYPQEVLIEKSMFAYQLEELVERKKALAKLNHAIQADSFVAGRKHEKLKIDEYWNPYWHTIQLRGGEILVMERNFRGQVRFQQAYTGDGLLRSNAELADPEDLCGSLYDGNWDALMIRDQQMSARHTMLMRKAYASMRTDKSGPEVERALTDVARGEAVMGVKKGEIEVIEYPDVTADLYNERQAIDQDIIEGSYPPNVHGQKQPGVDTVGQEALLSRAAQRIFDTVARVQAQFATTITEWMLMDLAYYGDPITVRGETLKPSDLGGVFSVRVEYPNPDPTLQQIEWQQAAEDLARGVIDEETYRQIRGIENDAKIRKGILKDYVRKHPSVIEAVAAAVAEDMGAPYTPGQGAQQTNGKQPQNGTAPGQLLLPNGQRYRGPQQ